MKNKAKVIKEKKYLTPLYITIGVIFLLILFEVIAHIISTPVFPPLEKIIPAIGKLFTLKRFYLSFIATLVKLLVTALISSILGLILGLISASYERFKNILKPLMSFLKSFPTVCLVLVLVALTKITEIVVLVFIILPIVYEAVTNSALEIGKRYNDDLLVDNIKTSSKILNVLLPLTLPSFFVSILQSLGLGLKALIMAEVLVGTTSRYGLGNMLNNAYINSNFTRMFALAFVSLIIVLGLDVLLTFIKGRIEKKIS